VSIVKFAVNHARRPGGPRGPPEMPASLSILVVKDEPRMADVLRRGVARGRDRRYVGGAHPLLSRVSAGWELVRVGAFDARANNRPAQDVAPVASTRHGTARAVGDWFLGCEPPLCRGERQPGSHCEQEGHAMDRRTGGRRSEWVAKYEDSDEHYHGVSGASRHGDHRRNGRADLQATLKARERRDTEQQQYPIQGLVAAAIRPRASSSAP
jgi:hypothetical protein